MALFLAACSGGAGSPAAQNLAELRVLDISVSEGEVWQINRPIDVTFNRAIDFSTISLNTVRIFKSNGASAIGGFTAMEDDLGRPDHRVRFEPICPTLPDFSDAGLTPGGIDYTLLIVAAGGANGTSLVSREGYALGEPASVRFSTPVGSNPSTLLLDSVPGPPAIRLRGSNGVALDDLNSAYIELGEDPDQRIYFRSTGTSQFGRLLLPNLEEFEAPINKYSVIESHIAAVVHFNQPVSSTITNINSDSITFEYEAAPGAWYALGTAVELIENCSATGAAVRLRPLGVLPQGTPLRLNVRAGFQDLTGDRTLTDLTSFGRLTTRIDDGPHGNSDELLEDFILEGPASIEDTETTLPFPRANWRDGKLEAAFDFEGTGGPNGNFDWYLQTGQVVILDTSNYTIIGGPGGTPTTSQTVINGLIDVRDLYVPLGAQLIFVGPNPVRILASGEIRIAGEVSVRGSDGESISGFNLTFVPEPGAEGNAGGGRGGTGSYLTNANTPRGGSGTGAFNVLGLGGQGGEASYGPGSSQPRVGSGGGGARFGRDVKHKHDAAQLNLPLVEVQTLIGMDAEAGFAGGPAGTGAVNQMTRALGGEVGPVPFTDQSDDNDFFGALVDVDGTLILGELTQIWAGSGGGAGGDAVFSSTFPVTPFSPFGDERGAGGGGGAGGLSLMAIGPITVFETGRINADGGDGASGELSIGGGSGGGSGGHIVLSSAAYVEVRGEAAGAGDWYRDEVTQASHPERFLSALGGQGGSGNLYRGGASFTGQTQWRCDAIPAERVVEFEVPPYLQSTCFSSLPNIGDDPPGWPCTGTGGDGGPGIIQIHVGDPLNDIRFPGLDGQWGVAGNAVDVSKVSAPPPFGWIDPDSATRNFLPFFGRFSVSQTKWIPLGLARINSGNDPVAFFHEGLDEEGYLERLGDQVQTLPAVLGPLAASIAGALPSIAGDGLSITFAASALAEELKANPQLLRRYEIRLEANGNVAGFEVVTAAFDSSSELLECWIASETLDDMADFVVNAGSTVAASLIPHYFRLSTAHVQDDYPNSTRVRVLFDAAQADALGNPDESASYSAIHGALTGNAQLLNATEWDFVRLFFEFDLQYDDPTVAGVPPALGPLTPRPGFEHFRLPFRF